MMYVDFNAGNETYKLRLSTRSIVALEKQLGCNPVAVFGNGSTIPKLTDIILIFHASLQQLNHGITLDKAYEIFDEWLADGNSMTDFISVILEIYKVSGLIKEDNEEKN